MQDKEITPEKAKSLLSIKKASGTLAKVQRMVEDNSYCPDIIQQIDACIGLLNSSKKNLLLGHLDHCLLDKLQEDKTRTIDELVRILDLK